ncbi:hypothetical protein AB4K20DRAFT_1872114 [Rhizopus microsporus]
MNIKYDKKNNSYLARIEHPTCKHVTHNSTVKPGLMSNCYYFSSPIDGAVNGDMLKPFNESARMTPDVTVSRAHEQFQSWVLNKSAVLSVSAVPPKMPTACEGVHEKCYNSAVASVDIT